MTCDSSAAGRPIDVWDVHSFDSALLGILEKNADLLCAGLHDTLFAVVGELIKERTIRAFHYTRMTNYEIANLKRDGIHLSTPAFLRQRLDALVDAGHFSRKVADQIYAKSPFFSDQRAARCGRFWMASHPIVVEDGGVERLLAHWGGEVASWLLQDDETLCSRLRLIGEPRIIEIGVPAGIVAYPQMYTMAQLVVTTFARSRGSELEELSSDIAVKDPLPPSAVLAVHTEGDESFAAMGRGYPS